MSNWAANTAYVLGNTVTPTVPDGHSFVCTKAGTSGGSEPPWVTRYATISDGSAQWHIYTIISPSDVRAYMDLNDPATAPGGADSSRYSDDVIGGHIVNATTFLERATGRFLCDRPGSTLYFTTLLAAQTTIPALRTATSVTWSGSLQTPQTQQNTGSYWLIPDPLQTGVYIRIAFRAYRADANGMPWWLADSMWFDKAMDSPFYPGNYGGGYFYTSLPNDLIIVGDWGYAPGQEPGDILRPLTALAAFDTMRPVSIMADVSITSTGGVINYSQLPAEVRDFISAWKTGTQAMSVG